MRKLVSNNLEVQNNDSVLNAGCTCIAHCGSLDPESLYGHEYWKHIDDNNSVNGGGAF